MRRVLTVVFALAIASPSLFAQQCETNWQSQTGEQSVLGEVTCLARWDPDGSGPQPEQLVVGGQFSAAGSLAIGNLALFDPVTQVWSAIGGGTDGEVLAIEVQPNGGLVIAGTFTQVNGVTAAGIAAWNGTTWSGLPGAVGTVMALGHDSSGELVAGGLFSSIGGVAALNVARWDGTNWNAMGAGLAAATSITASPGVHDLAVLANGTLVAAGVLAARVATWDGTNWTALPSPPGFVLQLTELAPEPNGSLVCGGMILSSSSVVRWDGTSWSTLGNLDSEVTDVELMPNGDVIACGNANTSGVFRWNGSAWSTIGSFSIFTGQAQALQPFAATMPGQFFVGGNNTSMGSAIGSSLFFYDGSTWVGDVAGANGFIQDLVAFPNGETYAIGSFTQINGINTPRIARWGTSWQAVGNGLPATVGTIAKLANGDLVASTQQGVHRFDGSTWQLMPGSPSQSDPTMLLRPNGDLLFGGQNSLWVFDGSTWSQIPGINRVLDMENLPNGNVVLTGVSLFSFPISNGRIAEWDGGTTWTALDPSFVLLNPHDVEVMPSGNIAVVDVSQNGVRVLNGATWAPLGALNGRVNSLRMNAANELFAGGVFTADGSNPCPFVAHWTGTSWRAIAGGSPSNTTIIAPAANGDLLATVTIGSPFSQTIVSHRTSCPASAVSYSPACAGATTTSELTATRLPLLGGDYEARATGLSNNVLVFDLFGLQAVNLPLPNLLQLGLPGCVLAVAPIDVRMASAQSTLTSSFAIPSQQNLAGFDMRHQMLLLDVGQQNNLLAASTTNAILVTLGSPH